MVSLTGMACGILAGAAYGHFQDSWAVILGFVLMIAWHVMDGADGQLARLTNSQSEFGRLLDGICDYVTFIAVYAALGIALAKPDGALIVIIALAGACHAVQSAAYEAQRQDYVFWAWNRGARPASIGADQPRGLLGAYARLQGLGSDAGFDQALDARLTASTPAAAEVIRARYRERFAPALRHWSILSANYRSFGIFICAVIGRPMLYFGFEIIGFSLILLFLARRQTARRAGFIAELQP
jgi:hypothetical protein